jgi:hypothetical protein
MKKTFIISVSLNLALLGCLAFFPVNRVKPAAKTLPPVVASVPTPAAATVTSPKSSPPPAAGPRPFQWRQLYAGDYHAYVKNLRAIGCPEPTLRAIVAADVHAVFQPRENELEKKLSDLANSSWTNQLAAWNRQQTWKSELLHLPDEEAAMLASCLDETSSAALTADTGAPATTGRQADADAGEPIVAPLVSQPVDLAALNLDEGQVQAIADLQKTFLQKIGGPGQDPNDPAYQARWRVAQAEVDNLMQGMIGDQAYQDYQMQAFARAQAKTAGGPSN